MNFRRFMQTLTGWQREEDQIIPHTATQERCAAINAPGDVRKRPNSGHR